MKNNDTSFLSTLNEPQKEAVLHTKGPLLVIAGAGSGKTRVITTRISHLISQGSKPSQILALTFTNKAAREMFERIEKELYDSFSKPFIGTFHGYCLQLLKKYSSYLHAPTFTILDSDDQQHLIQTIIKKANIEERLQAKNVAHNISRYKNASALHTAAGDDIFFDQQFIKLYRLYEQEKKACNSYDFDDLLFEAHKLFTKHPQIRQEFHQNIRHILVDEYQDTNHIQGALLKSMALDSEGNLAIESLCAVGDEDQSIYSWRGATIENIISFPTVYPNTTTIKIEQNYRSVQPILDIANHIIKKNRERNPKKLWSEKKATDRIRILQCMSSYQEADILCALLKIQKSTVSLKSCAILYRAHYQSRTIEEALIKQSVPYKIIGGIQFYERKEIKDLLAYIKIVVNPYDRVSFLRIVNCPPRGLGAKFEEQLQELWNTQPLLHTLELIDYVVNNNIVPKLKKDSLLELKKILCTITKDDAPTRALSYIIGAIEYYSYLKKGFVKDEAETKIENVKELLRAAEHFQKEGITTISALLDEIALMQEHYNKDEQAQDYIQLMTLHAAKGLEFDTVIIPGLEETIFPSVRSLDDPKTLEEERRLFYVGITRAKERLILTWTRYRYSFGSMTEQSVSRFLKEIPGTLAVTQDCSYWDTQQCEAYIREWLNIKRNSNIITFSSAKKTSTESSSKPTSWKISQPVYHTTFGVGTVEKIEQPEHITPTITVRFKVGIKKIKSNFLASL